MTASLHKITDNKMCAAIALHCMISKHIWFDLPKDITSREGMETSPFYALTIWVDLEAGVHQSALVVNIIPILLGCLQGLGTQCLTQMVHNSSCFFTNKSRGWSHMPHLSTCHTISFNHAPVRPLPVPFFRARFVKRDQMMCLCLHQWKKGWN